MPGLNKQFGDEGEREVVELLRCPNCGKELMLMPPLIAHFKWRDGEIERRQILFYPFIPKIHLKQRKLSPTARRANYKMFDYIGLDKLPHFKLYEK